MRHNLPSRGIPALIYFGVTGLVAASVLTFPLFPTQDGPVHLYYSVILADLLHGGHTFSSAFQIRNVLAPYSLHSYLLILLNEIFDPLMSERVVAAIAIVWLAAGCWRLARAVHGAAANMQVLFLPILSTWALYMGLYNFVLGTGTLFYLMGWWLDNETRLTGRRMLLFWAGIIVLAGTHPVPLAMFFLFAGVLLAVQVAHEVWKRGPGTDVMQRMFVRKATALTGLAVGSLVFLWVDRFVTAKRVMDQIPSAAGVGRRALSLLSLHEISPLAPQQWLETIALLAAMLASVILVIRHVRLRPLNVRFLAVTGMAAVCLAIYLLGPGEVNGSFLFEKRFSMVVCFLIVALASGGIAVPLRTRQVMTSIALASALTATLVDREATWKNIASLEPLLHAAPLEPGSRILAVRFGATRKTELHYDPWNAAASYWCLRTRAVLINLPWMDLDIMMLKAAPGATSIDYEDAGALIRKAVDEKRATLPLSPDGLVIERSALGPAEEDHLVSELTAHYGYSLLSPKGSVIVLARPGALTSPPNAQVSRKGF